MLLAAQLGAQSGSQLGCTSLADAPTGSAFILSNHRATIL